MTVHVCDLLTITLNLQRRFSCVEHVACTITTTTTTTTTTERDGHIG